MKRSQTSPAPAAGSIPAEVFQLAKEKLQDDYLGFVAGTATDDPKQFAARHVAARAALDHLALLCTLAGEVATPDDAPNATDELLLATRADMADENKS
jgi:hypothetical protein